MTDKIIRKIEIEYKTEQLIHNLTNNLWMGRWGFGRYKHRGKNGKRKRLIIEERYKARRERIKEYQTAADDLSRLVVELKDVMRGEGNK